MQDAWTDEKKMLASLSSQQRITDELRKQLSDGSKKLWEDGKYRRVQSEKRAMQSWSISSIQTQLYEILQDLDIKFFREYNNKPNDPETIIDGFNFVKPDETDDQTDNQAKPSVGETVGQPD